MIDYNKIINEAIDEVYLFNKWEFKNEAEFKHELFHILTNKINKNIYLDNNSNIAKIPVLHAEARPENGVNSKADIIICNPKAKIQPTFNYSVEYLLELKYKLRNGNIFKSVSTTYFVDVVKELKFTIKS